MSMSYEHVRETMARLERIAELPGPAGESARRELASLHEQCRADTAIELPPIVLPIEEELNAWDRAWENGADR